MTELMKRYEAETDEIATWSWHNKEFVTDDVLDWASEKIQALDVENTQLKAQLTWRPVSEKPKEGQIVFVMVSTGWVVAQYLNGVFYIDDGFTFGDLITGVTHWLPIPPKSELLGGK